jgi:hypothetical protein
MSPTKEFKLFGPSWFWTKMCLDEMADMPLLATVDPRIAVIRWGTPTTISHTIFLLAHSCKFPSRNVSTEFSNLMTREFLKESSDI